MLTDSMGFTPEQIEELKTTGSLVHGPGTPEQKRALARAQLQEIMVNRMALRTEWLVKEEVMERADVEFRKLAIQFAIPYLEKIIREDEAADSDRLKAAKMILDRAFGTPKETIEVSSVSLKVDI